MAGLRNICWQCRDKPLCVHGYNVPDYTAGVVRGRAMHVTDRGRVAARNMRAAQSQRRR